MKDRELPSVIQEAWKQKREIVDRKFKSKVPPYDPLLVKELTLGEDVSPTFAILTAHYRDYLSKPENKKVPDSPESSTLKNIREILFKNLSENPSERDRLVNKFVNSAQDEAFMKTDSPDMFSPPAILSPTAIVSKTFHEIAAEYRQLVDVYNKEGYPMGSIELDTINKIVYDLITGPQSQPFLKEPPYDIPLSEKVRRKIPGAIREFHPALRPQIDNEAVIFSKEHTSPLGETVRRRIPPALQEFHPALRPKVSLQDHQREEMLSRLHTPRTVETTSPLSDYSFYQMGRTREVIDPPLYVTLPTSNHRFRITLDSQQKFLQDYFYAN